MSRSFRPRSPALDVSAAWQSQLERAQQQPWLLQELISHGQELFPRFSRYYAQLSALPRKTRRALKKQFAHSLAGAALLLALSPGSGLAANFNASNDTELIAAINTANTNGEADTITLTADITLTAVDNSTYGDSGLPVILPDGGNAITIEGANFTIERDSGALSFRIATVGPGGDLTLNETTISGGVEFFGGGLANVSGSLSLVDSQVSGNTAGLVLQLRFREGCVLSIIAAVIHGGQGCWKRRSLSTGMGGLPG